MNKHQDLKLINSRQIDDRHISNFIRKNFSHKRKLNILEAGCGRRWTLDLKGMRYTLTGVDINRQSLEIRKNQQKDLHEAIAGDLRTIKLEENSFDIIYCSYVIEHIKDVKRVLDNFIRWLKLGGILILRIPDKDTVYGFVTKITPFWIHLFYKKHLLKMPNAGKPGCGPFPTFFDKIMSRKGVHDYCQKHGIIIKIECGLKYNFSNRLGVFSPFIKVIVHIIEVISFGKLRSNHVNLSYIIQKPTKLKPI